MRIFFGVVFLLVLVATDPVFAVDGAAQGTAAGRMALGRFGGTESSNSNISVPMTNSDTQLYTLDGSKGFNAALSSPSSSKFLQILIQPSGTGDLQKLIVSQDINTDGTFDYTADFPITVSGVCLNGLISCEPGTWAGCNAYKWVANAAAEVTLSNVPLPELINCYCINSSCGSQLVWNNSASILRDLGAGVIAAMQSSNASYMITNVSTEPLLITYHGNNLGASTSPPIAAVTTNPTVQETQQMFSTYGALGALSDSAPLTFGADPNSLYSQVLGASAMTTHDRHTCEIKRIGNVTTTTIESNYDTGTGALCTDHYINMQIKRINNWTYELKLLDTSPTGVPHAGCNDDPGGDGWHLFKTLTLPEETGNVIRKPTKAIFTISNIYGDGCTTGGSASIDAAVTGFDVPVPVTAPCPASGAQTAYFDWSYFFEWLQDDYAETISNSCESLEGQSECRLQEEKTDGVLTVSNFSSTGLTPLLQCKSFTGQVEVILICRPWWQKNRTYVCASRPYDFDAVSQRFGTVSTSLTESWPGVFSFDDSRQDEFGNWVTTGSQLTLDNRNTSTPTCEQACKVSTTKEEDKITTSGLLTSQRLDNTTTLVAYRPCVDNVCPLGEDESIIQGCSCLNDFGRAGAVMQVFRVGGADQICSTGVSKPLGTK